MMPYGFDHGYGYDAVPELDVRQINRGLRFLAKKLARKNRRKKK